MIEFIKGEDKHVKFKVHSALGEIMIVEHANYSLSRYGEIEAEGQCEIKQDEEDTIIDMKLYPEQTGTYCLEITYMVADEILKHREQMKVI